MKTVRPLRPYFEGMTLQNRRIVAESINSLSNSVNEILEGYNLVGTNHKHSDTARIRSKARHARRWQPYIIRGADMLIIYAYARPADLGGVTTNPALQTAVDAIVNNPASNAWNLIKNAERELTDGEMIVLMNMTKDGNILVTDIDPNQFNKGANINNPKDGITTWLHHRAYNDGLEDKVIYYPDCNFWPSPELRKNLERRVKKGKGGAGVDWDIRALRTEFNGGVPVVAPAIAYAQCLDSIIEMQTAVLSSIASAATQYETDDVVEAQQAIDAFEEMGEGEFEAHTVVGSGRLRATNLKVAMLDTTAAVYALLHRMVYNSFSGLRPQDWAESEVGGLSSNKDKDRTAENAARLRQNVFSAFYENVLTCALVWQIAESSLSIDGVELIEDSYTLDGATLLVRMLNFGDGGGIQVSWPEQKDVTIDDVLKAFGMDGVGTPEEFESALKKVGINATVSGGETAVELMRIVRELRAEIPHREVSTANAF